MVLSALLSLLPQQNPLQLYLFNTEDPKNLVFAFSMCFEVNIQVKTEGEVLQVTLALVLVE